MSESPILALQAALVAALRAEATLSAEISGIFDGPPPRAAFPYVAIGSGASGDWSTKTEAGREVRLAMTIWDDGEDAARLHRLMHAAGEAVIAIPPALTGWRIVSLVPLRTLVARDPAGPWAGLIEHRARLLATP